MKSIKTMLQGLTNGELREWADDKVFTHIRRWDCEVDKRLARAVAGSHPDVALRTWKGIADRLIGEVKPRAYQEAVVYLEKMREVYGKTGRIAEWRTMIDSLRVEHKPKRRLMEVLDDLEIRCDKR